MPSPPLPPPPTGIFLESQPIAVEGKQSRKCRLLECETAKKRRRQRRDQNIHLCTRIDPLCAPRVVVNKVWLPRGRDSPLCEWTRGLKRLHNSSEATSKRRAEAANSAVDTCGQQRERLAKYTSTNPLQEKSGTLAILGTGKKHPGSSKGMAPLDSQSAHNGTHTPTGREGDALQPWHLLRALWRRAGRGRAGLSKHGAALELRPLRCKVLLLLLELFGARKVRGGYQSKE